MSRTRTSSPNISCANASSVPLRSANEIPSSTASPSTWWNTGRCVASTASRAGRRARGRPRRRRRLRLHRPDLHRGGLGAEQQAGAGDVDVQGVLHRARGVVGGDVERLEVVPLVLDLGTLGHPVPHPREDLDDPVLDEAERMQRARARAPAGQGDVDGVGARAARPRRPASSSSRRASSAERRSANASLVRRPRSRRASAGNEPSELWTLAERRLASQDGGLRLVELLERARRRDHRAPALELLLEDARGLGRVHGAASLQGPFRALHRSAPLRRQASVGGTGRSSRKLSSPSETPADTSPPWASATPSATNSPILLPDAGPGRAGTEQALGVVLRELGPGAAGLDREPAVPNADPRRAPVPRSPTTRATPRTPRTPAGGVRGRRRPSARPRPPTPRGRDRDLGRARSRSPRPPGRRSCAAGTARARRRRPWRRPRADAGSRSAGRRRTGSRPASGRGPRRSSAPTGSRGRARTPSSR